MINDYKVVTVTPVGRKKYLQILVPYLLKNRHIIDEHIFWINSKNTYDLSYVHLLCCKYPDFFKMVSNTDIQNDNDKSNIRNLYSMCKDPNTIYLKINDDICWMHPNAIANIVDFRIKHKDFFLIYPLIINNGRAANLHQIMGIVPVYLTGEWPGTYHWEFDLKKFAPNVGEELHKILLEHIKSNQTEKMFIGKYIITNREHIPEHMICWYGKDLLNLEIGNEQNWLTQTYITNADKYSCICGTSLVSHFAYANQEEYLTSNTNLLDEYHNLAVKD